MAADDDHHILHPTECPEWQMWAVALSKIIARAWTDEAFRKRLVAAPAAVLREHELSVPDGMEVVVREGATEWALTGSALTGAARFELPLPPKPDLDRLVQAMAEGERGHPPVLAADGEIAFSGIPAGADPSEARRLVDARRLAEGRRLTEFRRLTELRRLTEGRRLAEERDDATEAAPDPAPARRMTEARRLAEDRSGTGDAPATPAPRKPAKGKRGSGKPKKKD